MATEDTVKKLGGLVQQLKKRADQNDDAVRALGARLDGLEPKVSAEPEARHRAINQAIREERPRVIDAVSSEVKQGYDRIATDAESDFVAFRDEVLTALRKGFQAGLDALG